MDVTLEAFDEQGKLARNLPVERIRIKGGKLRLAGIALDTGPRRVFVVLDPSESSQARTLIRSWPDSLVVANELAKLMKSGDQMAICLATEKGGCPQPLTSDPQAIQKAIEALPEPGLFSKGRRTVREGVAEVLKQRGSEPQFGDSIVLLSDGHFIGETSGLRGTMARNAVRVFVVFTSFPAFSDARLMDTRGGTVGELRRLEFDREAVLQTEMLALETGAIPMDPFYSIPVGVGSARPGDDEIRAMLEAQAAKLFATITQTYRLSVELPNASGKDEKLDLEYLDESGRPSRAVKLIFPKFVPNGPARHAN